jgi:hypothetical protein
MFGLGLGIGLGQNVAALGGGGGGAATWNGSSDTPASSADYARTNANLTATRGTAGGNESVFGSTSHSGTGDWSFDITFAGNAGGAVVGLASSSHATNTYVGGDAASIGVLSTDGQIYSSAGGVGTGSTYVNTDTIKVRLKNGKAYFAKNGTYMNSANPTSETGGIDVSGLGALYPACSAGTTTGFTLNPSGW